MKKLLLSSAAFAALTTAASAADIGVPREPIGAAVVAPVFSWTGFYAGLQIGYEGSSTRGRFLVGGVPVQEVGYNTNGLFGGVHVGYNYQFNYLVVGLQGELEAGGINGSFTFANGDQYRSRISLQGALLARAGFAWDRALFYVNGGLALANLEDSIFNNGLATRVSSSGRAGWAIGAGIEYAFTPNWTARVEYRYTDYGTRSFSAVPAFPGTVDYRNRFHAVRVGVSYLFSTGPGPIVGRY
jgi:outer membrane immunogenic protein